MIKIIYFTATLQAQTVSSIHVFFAESTLPGTHRGDVFFKHFEKIGRGLLWEGKRREGECAVWAKRGGMNRKF